MLGLRHQLPVHSPLGAGALLRSLAPGTGAGACAALQRELADSYRADAVVLCGSGTQALQLALAAAAVEEVALPAFTCYEVASAAVGARVRVRLYDVDPDTLSPDAASLENALRAGAGAVVVAPLYGVPVAWSELEALATAHGALLIEDAAQGHGGSWRGARLGSLGPASVVSFGRGKGWTGSGGGALLLRRSATRLLEHAGLRSVRATAGSRGARPLLMAAAQWAMARPSIYRVPLSLPGLGVGETHYHPPRDPVPMPPAAAVLARATRAEAEAEATRRHENALRLLATLAASPAVETIRLPAGGVGGYLRLPLRLAQGLDSFPAPERALRLGVGRSYPTTLAELPALARLLAGPARIPGAQALARELVTLPTHSRISERERAELLRLLLELPRRTRQGERARR